MRRDIIITFITNGLTFIFSMLVYKLAASHFGPAGFGEYTLARRAVTFLSPVLMMGLSVGLVRYIAITDSQEDGGAKQAAFILAGYTTVTVFSVALLAAVMMLPGLASKAVFGRTGYEPLVRIIAFLCEAYVLNMLVYSYYRGKGRFRVANVINTCTQGIIPFVALFTTRTVPAALSVTAIGVSVFSASFLYPVIRDVRGKLKGVQLVPCAKELLRYGTARVPGDFAGAGMMALPAFLTANFYGIKEAGFVAFGVSLVNMVGAIFGPIGMVTLPRLSSMVHAKKHEDARVILKKIITYTTVLSVAVTAGVMVFAGYLVQYWLGSKFMASTDIIRLAALASVPNALVVSLRSSIDAAYVKAINASNVYKALAVSLVAYVAVKTAGMNIMGIPLAFVLGMVVLSALTMKVALNAYGLKLSWETITTWE